MKAVKQINRKYFKYKSPASDYRELTNITSTGGQYIDTGVGGNSCSKVELSIITPNSTSYTDEEGIFGSTWIENGFLFIFYQNKFRWHSAGVSVDTTSVSLSTKYDIVCQKTSLTVNGIEYSLAGSGANTTDNIKIFAPTNHYGIFTLLSFKMYDMSNVLIRNFIPCKNMSDSSIGLYDKVNNLFYNKIGSTAFTAGEYVVEESTSADYDFFIDRPAYKFSMINNKTYGILQ